MTPAGRATWTRYTRLVAGALTMVTVGCGPGDLSVSGVGSGTSRELRGHVLDDGANLPGAGRNAPIAGVRIEVLDGPKQGIVVMTDSNGNYKLPPLHASPVTVRASKDGFDGDTETFYPEYLSAPYFVLGQPPHTLWGIIALARAPAPTSVGHVRVEILDGPNAGKETVADDNGRYVFDDLVASPTFMVRLSKEGHLDRTYNVYDFRYNQRANFQIELR